MMSWPLAVKIWNASQPFHEDLYGIPRKGGDSYKEVQAMREEEAKRSKEEKKPAEKAPEPEKAKTKEKLLETIKDGKEGGLVKPSAEVKEEEGELPVGFKNVKVMEASSVPDKLKPYKNITKIIFEPPQGEKGQTSVWLRNVEDGVNVLKRYIKDNDVKFLRVYINRFSNQDILLVKKTLDVSGKIPRTKKEKPAEKAPEPEKIPTENDVDPYVKELHELFKGHPISYQIKLLHNLKTKVYPKLQANLKKVKSAKKLAAITDDIEEYALYSKIAEKYYRFPEHFFPKLKYPIEFIPMEKKLEEFVERKREDRYQAYDLIARLNNLLPNLEAIKIEQPPNNP